MKKNSFLNLPSKLVDCWGKNRLQCELYITEGDSAAGGLIEARNSETTAIFPIRGKIISSYKNSASKIFNNQEVQNIIQALGLELDKKSLKLIYDIIKLRYGKIFLAADGDPDGASIRNLLIELFWWLCPELIIKGHLYTTMPPLFRITTKNNQYVFLSNKQELDNYKKEHSGENFLINRNKGLGEQDSEELFQTLLNPDTRNVAQLTLQNSIEVEKLIQDLLGTGTLKRKKILFGQNNKEGENNNASEN